MKKIIRLSMVLFFLTYTALITFGDPPIPPAPGTNGFDPGNNSNTVGAPIDNGYILLIIFALLLGGIKIYSVYKAKKLASKEDSIG
jgi:hypothetical protein